MELLSVMLQIQHEALSTLGLAVAIGIAVFAAAFGIGRIGQSALEGIARQPESASDIRTTMIIGLALIEALVIYVLVAAFAVK